MTRVSLFVLLLVFPSSTRAQTWDTRFGSDPIGDPGLNGAVNVIQVVGGSTYVGGAFQTAGGVYTQNIARFDGAAWNGLDTGVNGAVNALASMPNGDLFVGGNFNAVNGGPGVYYIARWDGSAWYPLTVGIHTGMDQGVLALAPAPNGVDLYAGGNFTMGGGVSLHYVGLWDGTFWNTVSGNNFNGAVYDICTVGNDTYFGGDFTIPFTRVAHYNGSGFELIQGGPNARVYAVAIFQGELYVAGSFTQVGGIPAAGVARWDGAQWHAVASTLITNYGGPLRDLIPAAGALYLAGGFSAINGVQAKNVARWTGIAWSPLSNGVGSLAFSLGAMPGGEVYVGGDFGSVGGFPAGHIAHWNGTDWGFGGVNDQVRDMAYAAGSVIVAGDFTQVGETAVNRLASWDGAAWHDVGGGVDGSARCVATNGFDTYVGGAFANAGGVPAAGIAHWDGNAWTPLGYGVSGIPYDMAFDGADLYVGGALSPIGSPAAYIARWDGAAWHTVGDNPDAAVRTVVVDGGNVYIGGDFTTIGALSAAHAAVWDGAVWSPLGGGVNGVVYSVAVDGSDVYVAGDFKLADGTTSVNGVAQWDGAAWSAMGSGLEEGRVIRVAGNQVLVGGDFSTAGGPPASNLARWAGTWTELGGGTDDRVLAMAVTPDGVYVGGAFTTAGTTTSRRIGLWTEEFPTPVDRAPAALRLEQNAPNPFNPQTTIRYMLDRPGRTLLRVYDVRGARVRTLVDEPQGAGAHAVDWDGRDDRGRAVASGVYFYRLETPAGHLTRKMTILK